jgi:hypothetical protein
VKPVSEAFLLQVAGITASLLGFFVVGIFFYVQRGLFPRAAQVAQQYMQAATRTMIVLYGMTMSVSLALVVLEPPSAALLYLGVSVVLLWSVVRTSFAISRLHQALEIRVIPQIPMWLATAASVSAPWVIGGFSPSREHLTAAILLLGVFAFASSASLVLSSFDIARMESSALPRHEPEVQVDHDEDVEGFDWRRESPDSREDDAPAWQRRRN